eukprot:9192829-Pyramimonas_sp.AAC.1
MMRAQSGRETLQKRRAPGPVMARRTRRRQRRGITTRRKRRRRRRRRKCLAQQSSTLLQTRCAILTLLFESDSRA